MTVEVRRFASLAALSEAAADEVCAVLDAALAARGQATIALSGGSTPKALYADLRQRQLDWSRVKFFWSDERAVGPEDEHANFAMAKAALLDHLASPRVWRMHGEATALDLAAADYEAEITREVPGHVFDLILLGLGPDGHTASLFPGTAALAEKQKWVVANDVPQLKTQRLTFTYRLLDLARCVIFLAAGKDKAAPLARVLAGDSALPAQRVQAQRILWFVDRDAAQELA